MLTKGYIHRNRVNLAILIFLVLFGMIHYLKPALIYDSDGSFRRFGVGYSNRTVISGGIVAVILGILSYLAVLVYLAYY